MVMYICICILKVRIILDGDMRFEVIIRSKNECEVLLIKRIVNN